jgi:hypothetical protein
MAGTAMGIGIGSLVLSLATCCCWPAEAIWLVGGLVAVGLGAVSKRNIAAEPLSRGGATYALTGIITGAIAVAVAVVVLVLFGALQLMAESTTGP